MDIKDLHDQFCEYQLTIRNYQPTTIGNYRASISLFLDMLPHIHSIQQVSSHDLNRFFYLGRTERDWKPVTFISHHKNLAVFFKWCVKRGYIQEDPSAEIEKPKLEKRLPKALNKQQAMHLLQTVMVLPTSHEMVRTRNHAMFATFLYCGLRKGEVLKLKMQQVDLLNMTIFVNQGKGNKDRMVPIPYPLKVILERYMTERNKLTKYSDAFFVSLTHDAVISDSTLKRLTDAVKEESGIKFHLHMLRHTFATLMLEGGCDIYSLSKMMGHADISTTTIYLSASVEHMRSQILKHPLNG